MGHQSNFKSCDIASKGDGDTATNKHAKGVIKHLPADEGNVDSNLPGDKVAMPCGGQEAGQPVHEVNPIGAEIKPAILCQLVLEPTDEAATMKLRAYQSDGHAEVILRSRPRVGKCIYKIPNGTSVAVLAQT